VEKEWGDWSGTANLMLTHEWGSLIEDETEATLGPTGPLFGLSDSSPDITFRALLEYEF